MEPRASSDASLARLLPGAHCRLDVRVVDVVRLCVREDADVSWVVLPEARREALEDTTYALWRFMCLYSYVWYKSTVLTCLYTYEDRIEPQRCTRNVTLPASAVGGGRSREGSSHRAGTWAPVEQNVTSGLGNRGTAVHSRVRYTQKACSCARAIPIA